MNEKLMNMFFKIGLLLIGVAFLVIYFFHSQNGRFYKFGDANDWHILDTRSGVIYFSFLPTEGFASVNPTNGKVTKYDPEVRGDWTYRKPDVTAAPAAPGAAPGAPSAEDFLKGKCHRR